MSQTVGEPFYPALGQTFYPGEEFLDYCGLFSNPEDDTPYYSVERVGGSAWTAGGELLAASYVVNQTWWSPRPVLAWGKWGFVVRGTGTLTVQGSTDASGSWGWWDAPGSWPWTSLGTVSVDSTEYQTLTVAAPPEVADLDFPNRAQALLRVAVSGTVEIDRIFLRIASADGYFQKTGGGKFSQWYPAWDLPPVQDRPGYPKTYGRVADRGDIWDDFGPSIESGMYPPAPSLVQGTAEEMQNRAAWGVPKDGPDDGYTYRTGGASAVAGTYANFHDEYIDALGVLYPPTYSVNIQGGEFAVYFINWNSANSFPDPDIWEPIKASGKTGIHWDAVPGTYSIIEYEGNQTKMTLLGWTTYGSVYRSDPEQTIAATTNALVVAEGSTNPYFSGYVTSLHIVIVEGWTSGAPSPSPGDGTTVATFDYGSPGVYQQGAAITLPGTTERFAVLAWARFGTWSLASEFYPLWRSPAWRYWIPEWVLIDAGEIEEEIWPFWIKVTSGEGIETWHPIGTEDIAKLPGRFKLYGPGGWWKEFMPGDTFGVRRPLKLLVAEGTWVTVARMIPD